MAAARLFLLRKPDFPRSLAVRLLLLVVVATAPALVTLINLQYELRTQRLAQARSTTLRQAEQVNGSIGNVMAGAKQLMLAVARMKPVQDLNERCGINLTLLRNDVPQYAFLAVADSSGNLVCTSTPGLDVTASLHAIMGPAFAEGGFFIGTYATDAAASLRYLPMALPFAANPDGARGLIVAGLSLDWLGGLLAQQIYPTNSTVTVGDRNGVVLARFPNHSDYVGRSFLPSGLAVVNAAETGTAILPSFDGQSRLVGYVPATINPKGIYVSAGFALSDYASDIDNVAWRGYRLIALGSLLSLLLALFVGQRVVRAPASVLLDAARRWGRGDLAARATLPPDSAREFCQLSAAFNSMAETLQVQRSELQSLNEALEIRVAERTRALLESNNRLQVEIAEREMSELSLRQAQKLQAVGQLAGGIAHDFNNLLTTILGCTELLRRKVGSDAGQLRLVDAAAQAVDRGSHLTSRLLAFSRQQPLLSMPVDVAAAINSMISLLESTLGLSVRIETRIQPDLWPVLLDPHQFETAIVNLAINARDAMPTGGRLAIAANNTVIRAGSSEWDLPPGDYITVVVVDTGSGMTDEVASRAFEPFFTTRTLREGGGLGLSQVHGLVMQSNGQIRIASRVGDGTRITMVLPRCLELPRLVREEPRSPVGVAPGVILLVDDDDAVREMTASMLTMNGYKVLVAADGPTALAILGREGERVQLLIADYLMPGMNGRELLDRVWETRPELAVLLATGYADFTAMMADGASGGGLAPYQVLRKPFRTVDLLDRVHLVWDRHASRVAAGVPV